MPLQSPAEAKGSPLAHRGPSEVRRRRIPLRLGPRAPDEKMTYTPPKKPEPKSKLPRCINSRANALQTALVVLQVGGVGSVGWSMYKGFFHGQVPRQAFSSLQAEGDGPADPHSIIAAMAEKREPVVLTGSPVAEWAALNKWKPEELARTLPVLPTAYSHTEQTFTWSDPSRPLGRPPHSLDVRSPHGFKRDLDGPSFFSRWGKDTMEGPNPARVSDDGEEIGYTHVVNHTEEGWLYVSAKLHTPPYDSLSADAEPRGFLSAAADFPETSGQDANIWLSESGVISNTHYDPTHGVFVQVAGEKTMELWPPDAWSKLQPYPLAHPGHRQSSAAGRPEGDLAAPMTTKLRPGEILYIPPFWWHRAIATTFSASLTVWTDSSEGGRLEEAHKLGLPSSLQTSGPDAAPARAASAQRFLGALLSAAVGEEAVGYAQRIIESRYEPLGGEIGCTVPVEGCVAAGEGGAAAATTEELKLAAQIASALMPMPVISVVAEEQQKDPHAAAVGHVLVQDYVETLLGYAVGEGNVCNFLRTCML